MIAVVRGHARRACYLLVVSADLARSWRRRDLGRVLVCLGDLRSRAPIASPTPPHGEAG